MTDVANPQPASNRVFAVLQGQKETWNSVPRNLRSLGSAIPQRPKLMQWLSMGASESTQSSPARLTLSGEVALPEVGATQVLAGIMSFQADEAERRRTSGKANGKEETFRLQRERKEIQQRAHALRREEERLNRDRSQLNMEGERLHKARDRLHQEEERVQKARDRLDQEEERVHSMRTAGVCLFQGANNVSISGNSSFNIYYGTMGASAWITFVDASGRDFPIPEFFTWTYQTFLDAINLILQQDNEVARTQQRFIKRRMYDLCIDRGNEIIPINGQETWSKVERNTKVVMRIPIWQVPEEINSKKTYRCPLPSCNLWNDDPSMGVSSTIDCKGCNSRFQISGLLDGDERQISIPPSSPGDTLGIPFLKNYHVRSVSSEFEHHQLGHLLSERFRDTAEVANLTYAVDHYQKSIQLKPASDPSMSISFNSLGCTLRQRFEQTSNVADLAHAIEHCQDAVQLTPEDHPYFTLHLDSMGLALQLRFKQSGDLADLTSAIEYHQRSIRLTPKGHPDIPSYLTNVGCALELYSNQTGNLTYLTSAIEHHQRAIQLTPQGHHLLPSRLNSLGLALHLCFKQTGNPDHLTSSIEHLQQSIRLTPEGHSNLPLHLSNLGFALKSRFTQMGDFADLTSAIKLLQQAIHLIPEGHPWMPSRLSTVGVALQLHFKQTGDLAGLASAIEHHQKAVQLTPEGHPDKPSYLDYMGDALRFRFEKTGNSSDRAYAIECYQKALLLIPDTHWLFSITSSSLALLQAPDSVATRVTNS